MPNSETTTPNIVSIPIERLHANPWNPNHQTPEQFAENVAEMRRLGHPHNPITVRPVGQGFQILNGEHTWLAAKEIGLAEVLCEIVAVSDFEARLQTYKRNQHGTHDPLRLGLMFEQMLDLLPETDRSIRELARQIDVPEATLRHYLDYAKAANLRKTCAPGGPAAEISELSHDEVKTYLKLPPAWRDLWLEDGADIRLLTDLSPEPSNVVRAIARAGLEHLIEADVFRGAVQFAWAIAVKRSGHHRISTIDDYITPLATIRLGRVRLFAPPEVLDLLPCRVQDGTVEVLIAADTWAKIIDAAAARTTDPKRFFAMVQEGVVNHLRNTGVNPADVYGPEVGEALRLIDEAPDFIREADCLTLDERLRLAMAKADAADEIVLRAKEMTVEQLRKMRAGPDVGRLPNCSVATLFEACVQRLLQEQQAAAEDNLFGDPPRLREAVASKLAASPAIQSGVVDGRAAVEVLAERLRSLEPPEFALLAAALVQTGDPGRQWLKAVGGCASKPEKAIKRRASAKRTQ